MSTHIESTAPLFWRAEQLDEWSAWQRRQWPASRRAVDRARRIAGRVRGQGAGTGLEIASPRGPVHTLVALESTGPTQVAALAEPLRALAEQVEHEVLEGVAWLLPAGTEVVGLPGAALHRITSLEDETCPEHLRELTQVLVAGEYLPAGRTAVRWAREQGVRVNVVQHGLLAVSTPPVPADCRLFAFSARDGAWWTQSRTDVEVVDAGSALLWNAGRQTEASGQAEAGAVVGKDSPGVFLGQLHGAELPRSDFAAAAAQYIHATGATYRPHPAERDRLSRAQHEKWRAQGLTVDGSGPLTATAGPVAAVFSTGVLEAAQAGRPAYVVHPEPPAWLEDFWDRYSMSRWRPWHTPEPTPAFAMPHGDPAHVIARHLKKEIGA